MSWSADFATPISLPDGVQIVSLNDARDFLNQLRGYESLALEWQCAVAAVLLVGETGCSTNVARAALVEAIRRRELEPSQDTGSRVRELAPSQDAGSRVRPDT